jgi:hypothetical protein
MACRPRHDERVVCVVRRGSLEMLVGEGPEVAIDQRDAVFPLSFRGSVAHDRGVARVGLLRTFDPRRHDAVSAVPTPRPAGVRPLP